VNELYFAPTILEDVNTEAPVMKEEIFGPILPVFTFYTHEEAFRIIDNNPNPLSLYFFGNNNKIANEYIEKVQFGGGCIDNTLVYLSNSELPFGGVSNSGVGAYHGKFSFDTFTTMKSILKTSTLLDPSVKYSPYKGNLKMLKWFFK